GHRSAGPPRASAARIAPRVVPRGRLHPSQIVSRTNRAPAIGSLRAPAGIGGGPTAVAQGILLRIHPELDVGGARAEKPESWTTLRGQHAHPQVRPYA